MSIYCTVVPKIGFDTAKNGPSKVWATNNQPPMPTWNRIKRLWVLLPDQREDAYAYKRSVEDDPYPRERNWTEMRQRTFLLPHKRSNRTST